jgi:hypothetical protein
VRRVACIAAVVPILLLAACQSTPDLLTTLTSLAAEEKQAAAAPDAKAKAPALNAKGQPPQARAAPPATPCAKDFWGSCKVAAVAPDKAQAAAASDAKATTPPPPSAAAHSALCTKEFWGSCRLMAVKRNVDRWRNARAGKTDAPGRTAEPGKRTEPDRRPEPVIHRREVPAHSNLCHPRRRVVGEERASREEALKAADGAWMGEVRYDFGERYQDLNRAKDVRYSCNPSTVSAVLQTAQFRCSIEATPCRAPIGAAEEQAAKR